ncbi:MAG TPA: ACT domain-containing protein [Candidatus Acidoferrum sp.]|nr:ACT domain-containing protein [Candidatus Acidoferrum sp.]
MNAFIVDLKNKPGELAKVVEAISARRINITGFTGATSGGTGTLVLTTVDESGTRQALTEGQWHYRPIELVATPLVDKPGSLAEVTRALARAGINVEAVLPIAMTGSTVQVAFATDDPVKARDILDRQPVGASSR